MDPLLEEEIAAAGLRLLRVVARVVNESPECSAQRNEKWSFEFQNLTTGEGIVVTYAGPSITVAPN